MLRRGLRRFVLAAPDSGSSSLAGRCASAVRSRSNTSCSAQMIAERSDRAPKIRPFDVAICARRSSFSPSKVSTISVRAAGSEGRSSGRIAMSENYTKMLGIASKTGRFSRRSSAASSPSGPLATTPRDLRSASPIEPPSRALSPREPEARQSPLPRAILSPVPAPSRRKREASNDPIAWSGTRKRRRCRARRPIPPPPARPSHVRPFESRSAASPRTPADLRAERYHCVDLTAANTRSSVAASKRAPSRRRSSPRSVRSGRSKREPGPSCPAAPRLRRRARVARSTAAEAFRLDLCRALRHTSSKPRLTPLRRAAIGYVHLRIGALGQDPRLLRIAPIAPPSPPSDHLDPLISVGIMPGLMHGISARRVVESKREFRSAEHRMRGGAVVPVTSKLTFRGTRQRARNLPPSNWSNLSYIFSTAAAAYRGSPEPIHPCRPT